MKSYDVVVMGAGHNGLTAAAYLAKAGKKVLILERQPYPGGGVVTREINTPGYRHDLHSSCHIMIQGNPMLTEDELGLIGKHGLKYNYSNVPYASIFPDQSTLITYKDLDKACAEIAKLSPRDADTYRRFAERSMAMLPMFVSGLYAPPVPLGPFVAMLDSSDEGREMLDAMSRSSLDIIDDAFENDKVKIHLLKLVTENLQLPDELGTGMGIFLMPGIIHAYGVSQPIGGSGGLTDALVRCIESLGGEIRVNAEVTKISRQVGPGDRRSFEGRRGNPRQGRGHRRDPSASAQIVRRRPARPGGGARAPGQHFDLLSVREPLRSEGAHEILRRRGDHDGDDAGIFHVRQAVRSA